MSASIKYKILGHHKHTLICTSQCTSLPASAFEVWRQTQLNRHQTLDFQVLIKSDKFSIGFNDIPLSDFESIKYITGEIRLPVGMSRNSLQHGELHYRWMFFNNLTGSYAINQEAEDVAHYAEGIGMLISRHQSTMSLWIIDPEVIPVVLIQKMFNGWKVWYPDGCIHFLSEGDLLSKVIPELRSGQRFTPC